MAAAGSVPARAQPHMRPMQARAAGNWWDGCLPRCSMAPTLAARPPPPRKLASSGQEGPRRRRRASARLCRRAALAGLRQRGARAAEPAAAGGGSAVGAGPGGRLARWQPAARPAGADQGERGRRKRAGRPGAGRGGPAAPGRARSSRHGPPPCRTRHPHAVHPWTNDALVSIQNPFLGPHRSRATCCGRWAACCPTAAWRCATTRCACCRARCGRGAAARVPFAPHGQACPCSTQSRGDLTHQAALLPPCCHR